jgi:hypothetical protein
MLLRRNIYCGLVVIGESAPPAAGVSFFLVCEGIVNLDALAEAAI